MDNLLRLTIEAHGGLERWRQFDVVRANASIRGALAGSLSCHQVRFSMDDKSLAPTEGWGDHSQNRLHDMRIVGNT
jgi:hypothetical protein